MANSEEERAEEIRQRLADHDHRLHVLEHPTISELEADDLFAELLELEAKVGVPQTPDSPTLRLGKSPRSQSFERVDHPEAWTDPPMVQSVAELRAYHAQVARDEVNEPIYVASSTMPGADVLLSYVNGVLERAVLRGDGKHGAVVTDNIKTIRSVPLRLRQPGSITESRLTKLTRQALGPTTLSPVPPFPTELRIRASVAMSAADITALDRKRVDAGDPPYILPRGAVLGSLKRLDSRVTASRRLKLFAYGLDTPPSGIDSEWQLLGALKSWGFPVLPVTWRCKGLQEVLDFVAALQQIAPTFEYPLEGGLLKINRFGVRDEGVNPHVQLTFPTPGRMARVSKLYYAIGRGGSVLPVALLDPAPDSGLSVPERAPIPADSGDATLHVKSGTTVRVRPGTVAPILSTDEPASTSTAPANCPACQHELTKAVDEPFYQCSNSTCSGRARARLLHVIGPRGLRLSSINVKAVDRLQSDLGVLDAADLITLDPSKVDRALPGQGKPFEQEIARVKKLPLWRFLYLSAIPHVSEHSARTIAHHAFDLEGLEQLNPERCWQIPGITPEAAAGLANWIADEGPRTLARIKQAQIEILDAVHSFPAPFLGRTVVLAGQLENGNVRVTDEIERRGGIIRTVVGRTTDYLITGKNAAKEFDTAAMYRVPVIEETTLVELLHQTSGW